MDLFCRGEEKKVGVLQQLENGDWLEELRTYRYFGRYGEPGVPSPEFVSVEYRRLFRNVRPGEVGTQVRVGGTGEHVCLVERNEV